MEQLINVFIPVLLSIIMVSGIFQVHFWLHEFFFLILGAIFLLSWKRK